MVEGLPDFVFVVSVAARQEVVQNEVGHVATEEQYQTMLDAGAFDDDVVSGAADAILFERARALLLDSGTLGESL